MKVQTALHYWVFFFFFLSEELYTLMFLCDVTTSQRMYVKSENSGYKEVKGGWMWGGKKANSHSAVSYLLDLVLCTIDIAS